MLLLSRHRDRVCIVAIYNIIRFKFLNNKAIFKLFSGTFFLQIVGNRGNVEISPRFLMTEEALIIGCALFRSSPVIAPLEKTIRLQLRHYILVLSFNFLCRKSGVKRLLPSWLEWRWDF